MQSFCRCSSQHMHHSPDRYRYKNEHYVRTILLFLYLKNLLLKQIDFDNVISYICKCTFKIPYI